MDLFVDNVFGISASVTFFNNLFEFALSCPFFPFGTHTAFSIPLFTLCSDQLGMLEPLHVVLR
jgi:hypothetical protein